MWSEWQQAPAKVNLNLQVTGKREDGYHLLDSLVFFTSVGDRLRVRTLSASEQGGSTSDRLTITGPFADLLKQESSATDNLILKALAGVRQIGEGRVNLPPLEVALEKNLPVAAGIGGGSTDAAAMVRLLDRFFDLRLSQGAPEALQHLFLSLGADVPVCAAARPILMRGIGDLLENPPQGLIDELSSLGILLVNPRKTVSTPAIFQSGLVEQSRGKLSYEKARTETWVSYLQRAKNDLAKAACMLEPEIKTCLEELSGLPEVLFARMSGSGATCFALFPSPEQAEKAAKLMRLRQKTWWIADQFDFLEN